MRATELVAYITQKLPIAIISGRVTLGCAEVVAHRDHVVRLLGFLRDEPALQFSFFVSVTGVDWMDQRDDRFEVVYHLRSFLNLGKGTVSDPCGSLIRVKTPVPEDDAVVDSVTHLWPGANFMERECWDMLGIAFKDHPNLARILMYDEFKGHPLRKDYPVQGKQPRVALRAPEVENTARMMQRPSLGGGLIQITRRHTQSGGA